jgi:hypothetical protein
MLNSYFNNFSYGREQDLLEDLMLESIKIYGVDCKYIPRDLGIIDNLFGEAVNSSFNNAADLEMYVKNVEGFEGEGDFLSKFGLEIRDQVTFTVARKRFDQIRTEKTMLETGFNLLDEEASTTTPSRQFLANTDYQTESIQLEEGTANGYSISSNRPNEGDLIFFPFTKKLYEIKFVEHESIFYQTGRLNVYDLRCELFEYSSESVDTGFSDIDTISTTNSADTLAYQFQLEDDTFALMEDGGFLLQEFELETTISSANNTLFTRESLNIIDFSEANPFSEVDRY